MSNMVLFSCPNLLLLSVTQLTIIFILLCDFEGFAQQY